VIVIAGVLFIAAGCPLLAPAPGAPGSAEVVHVPAAAALALNAEGKALYRQERWPEAYRRYRAALETDPQFLAPALNAACALARQDRFAEAAREAAALVRQGFIPWGREALEAADLAVLHVRPEMEALRVTLGDAAARWGKSVMDGLFFVARTKPAVKLEGSGVLVLGLNQEIFAWLPAAGRYLQVTADDGRVLAAVRSDDGRTVVYIRGGKLVRAGQTPAVLRGLSLRRLEVATMTLGPPVELPGDVLTLSLFPPGASSTELRVTRPGGEGQSYRLMGEALISAPALSPAAQLGHPVRLTGAGVEESARLSGPAACPYQAADEGTPGQPPRVRVTTRNATMIVPAPFGAGLFGLPFSAPVGRPEPQRERRRR
jgi:hypothetical protein